MTNLNTQYPHPMPLSLIPKTEILIANEDFSRLNNIPALDEEGNFCFVAKVKAGGLIVNLPAEDEGVW